MHDVCSEHRRYARINSTRGCSGFVSYLLWCRYPWCSTISDGCSSGGNCGTVAGPAASEGQRHQRSPILLLTAMEGVSTECLNVLSRGAAYLVDTRVYDPVKFPRVSGCSASCVVLAVLAVLCSADPLFLPRPTRMGAVGRYRHWYQYQQQHQHRHRLHQHRHQLARWGAGLSWLSWVQFS